MKPTTTTVLAAILALALGACDRAAAPETPVAETPAAEPAPAPATAAAAINEAEALALVATIDQQEIDAAQLALAKATGTPVKDYATLLDKEHRDNLAQAQALAAGAATAETDRVLALKQQGATAMAALQAADPATFDHDFADAMAKGHADALTLIDEQLLPAVPAGKVHDFLEATRAAVANHLEQASALQAGG